MDNIQQEAIKRIDTMHLFEHDGRLHFGKWNEWWRATPEDKERLLDEFNKTVVNTQKELVNPETKE